jgi:hypothetical protein
MGEEISLPLFCMLACADTVVGTRQGGAMTINSPDSLPDDDPQQEETKDGTRSGKDADQKADGGIPAGDKGVGLGATGEPNTFEPEEDPEATDS